MDMCMNYGPGYYCGMCSGCTFKYFKELQVFDYHYNCFLQENQVWPNVGNDTFKRSEQSEVAKNFIKQCHEAAKRVEEQKAAVAAGEINSAKSPSSAELKVVARATEDVGLGCLTVVTNNPSSCVLKVGGSDEDPVAVSTGEVSSINTGSSAHSPASAELGVANKIAEAVCLGCTQKSQSSIMGGGAYNIRWKDYQSKILSIVKHYLKEPERDVTVRRALIVLVRGIIGRGNTLCTQTVTSLFTKAELAAEEVAKAAGKSMNVPLLKSNQRTFEEKRVMMEDAIAVIGSYLWEEQFLEKHSKTSKGQKARR